MQTTETTRWQNCALSVRAHLVPRFLWTTASIDVYVDKECVLQTGGQLKVVGSHSSNFNYLGATHIAALSWDVGFFYSFPYTLLIDGVPVQQGKVRVRNWILGFVPLLMAGVFMGCAFYVMNVLIKMIPNQ